MKKFIAKLGLKLFSYGEGKSIEDFIKQEALHEKIVNHKSKYLPTNKKAVDILKQIGFQSENRGYALPRKDGKRYHCLIELDGTIRCHLDKVTLDGKHETEYLKGREEFFYDIFRATDLNESLPVISPKSRKTYPTLKI